MKQLTGAVALAVAAMASGCATYDTPYGTKVAARAGNPTVVVAEGDNGAMPYTTRSMFFKDRGLHYEDPSALTPKVVEAPLPRG